MKKYISSLLFGLITSLSVAHANTEIVVPFVAGGTASNVAHLAAEALSDNGRPTIVVNKPGANSTIGANQVAKSKPDGQTLLLGAGSSMAANLAFGVEGMEYTEKSFVPVIPLGTIGWTLYVQGGTDIKNYEQFKTFVRANPSKFTIAFWNANYAKLFEAWAEKEGLPKPTVALYKGGTPAMTDVAGGHVLAGVLDFNATAELYKANKINIIATFDAGTQKRVVQVHGDQSVVDITRKHPEFAFNSWWGLYAPAGTPPETIAKINSTLNRAFKEPKFRAKIDTFVVNQIGGTANELNSWQQRDLKMLRSTVSK